jgi:hypothetical protein
MRFKSQTELATHLDLLFIRNQDKQRKEGTRTYRQWYCKESQWITDFGSLKRSSDTDKISGSSSTLSSSSSSTLHSTNKPSTLTSGGIGSGSHDDLQDEEMVLPADEHFTRCPVSNEAFLPEWDTEEGDYMYRNAVKVLLTDQADSLLYQKVGQSTDHPLIRYIIIHQKLVMDGWLAAGKLFSLYETNKKIQQRYGGGGGESGGEVSRVLIKAYREAAGEEEDSHDIFVLYEPIGSNGELGISDAIYQYETLKHNQQEEAESKDEPKQEPVEQPQRHEQMEQVSDTLTSNPLQEESGVEVQEATQEVQEQVEANVEEHGAATVADEHQHEEDGVAEMKMELQDP